MKKKKTEEGSATQTQPEKPEWQTAGQSDAWQAEKKGDSLIGIYVDSFTYVGKKFHNEGHAYKIRTDAGMKTVFGTGRLDRAMAEVPKNSEVQITYLGRVKSNREGGQDEHDWRVNYKTSSVPF